MTSFPEMVAGEARFDTDLMAACRGTVVCKGGAEGFQGVGLPNQALGIAAKITDGNPRAIPPTVMRALDGLSALPSGDGLDRYRRPEVRNHQDERVGRLVPLFRLGDAA
jgi:L-asparaginase